MTHQPVPNISLDELRLEIKKEYTNVALDPNKGYHFHTGRRLANLLGYDEALYADLPESNIYTVSELPVLLSRLARPYNFSVRQEQGLKYN